MLTYVLCWPSPQSPIQEQRKEIAAVIQRCYKKYKQVRVVNQIQLCEFKLLSHIWEIIITIICIESVL